MRKSTIRRVVSRYSKKEVRRAGETIASPVSGDAEKADAATVINYWRSLHRYPLQCLFDDLDSVLDDAPGYGIAGRIKKFDTIRDKLSRKNNISNLAAMYDVAGCRIVVPDLRAQHEVCQTLYQIPACDTDWSNRHNYIASPKDSGYRGRHLLFRYPCPDCDYSLAIELQVRTERQHSWATAVETYDSALCQRVKFGEGAEAAENFFRRAAELLALEEAGKPLPNEPRFSRNVSAGYIADALKVFDVLAAASGAVSVLGNLPEVSSGDYCLIDFDPAQQMIFLQVLDSSGAIDLYFRNEFDPDMSGHDFVLVRSASLEKIKRLYPNYFGDISPFVDAMYGLVHGKLALFG